MEIKLVVIGDNVDSSKVKLLYAFLNKSHNKNQYLPTNIENSNVEININDQSYRLNLWNSIGEDYDRVRSLSYPGTDVFVIVYDINDKKSFENVSAKWNPELSHHCPDVPKILVALNQTDDKNENQIQKDQGEEVAYKIGANFLECNLNNQKQVEAVFRTATLSALGILEKNTKTFVSRPRKAESLSERSEIQKQHEATEDHEKFVDSKDKLYRHLQSLKSIVSEKNDQKTI